MRTVIIDVGTHKFEELNILFCPSWDELATLIKTTIKKLIGRSDLSFSTIVNCWYFLLKVPLKGKRKNVKVIALEPNIDVCLKKLKRLKNSLSVIHFPLVSLGHDYSKKVDIVGLNIYGDSLSSSIYGKNKLSKVDQLFCLGIDFYQFTNMLFSKEVISRNDKIIIRMNCEGAELGVIKGVSKLINEGCHILSVMGSLADVKKIHGAEKYDEMIEILKSHSIDYKFFKGTDVSTWILGINETSNVISSKVGTSNEKPII